MQAPFSSQQVRTFSSWNSVARRAGRWCTASADTRVSREKFTVFLRRDAHPQKYPGCFDKNQGALGVGGQFLETEPEGCQFLESQQEGCHLEYCHLSRTARRHPFAVVCACVCVFDFTGASYVPRRTAAVLLLHVSLVLSSCVLSRAQPNKLWETLG